ncbi:hypothetical protein Gotri_010530 [Gossypium trilobum]|uniref:Transcription initiation factor IIA gamma subunit N-terminal domain-containing protein n=1 Tax=Gossypium trilobum TaxID=34281 RepID=A0A7J9ERA8_9ROSI|nr:hypothetical protein [Gossypium trilobum]
MATFELYRRSTIGMCLTEALDEMVSNGTLSPELAIQVLVQFDKSMTEARESQVKSKVTIKRLAVSMNSYGEIFLFYGVPINKFCVIKEADIILIWSFALPILEER